MSRDLKAILKLRVPVIVRIGERRMSLDHVLALSPGAIVDLPKPAELPLDLMVNNKVVGVGTAVKIGENFGLRVLEVGDAPTRVRALAGRAAAARAAADDEELDESDAPAPEADAADADADTDDTIDSQAVEADADNPR